MGSKTSLISPEDRVVDKKTVEDIELDLLLEAIYRAFGVDFRQYARSSVHRRLSALLAKEQLHSFSDLQGRLLRNPWLLDRVASALSIQVSSFFRDPKLYEALRDTVVPLLRTYPSVRIWHAGCATGEEVYSLAILMREEGLLHKCQFYATDISSAALETAERGAYPKKAVESSNDLYAAAGGEDRLHDHFRSNGRELQIDPEIRSRTVFFRHNLVTDGSFNEFHVVFCRNVLIYFSQPLQNRVHELLYQSLVRFGTLVLGANERLRFTQREKHYRALDTSNRIFRRID